MKYNYGCAGLRIWNANDLVSLFVPSAMSNFFVVRDCIVQGASHCDPFICPQTQGLFLQLVVRGLEDGHHQRIWRE